MKCNRTTIRFTNPIGKLGLSILCLPTIEDTQLREGALVHASLEAVRRGRTLTVREDSTKQERGSDALTVIRLRDFNILNRLPRIVAHQTVSTATGNCFPKLSYDSLRGPQEDGLNFEELERVVWLAREILEPDFSSVEET